MLTHVSVALADPLKGPKHGLQRVKILRLAKTKIHGSILPLLHSHRGACPPAPLWLLRVDRRTYGRTALREDNTFNNNNDYYNGDDYGEPDDEETLHYRAQPGPGDDDDRGGSDDEEAGPDDKLERTANDDDDGDMQPERRSKKRKTVERNFPHIELDLENGNNPDLHYNIDGLISKPPGEPGRASTGKKRGYCLRRAMGYPPELPDGHPSRDNARWSHKNSAYNFLHVSFLSSDLLLPL